MAPIYFPLVISFMDSFIYCEILVQYECCLFVMNCGSNWIRTTTGKEIWSSILINTVRKCIKQCFVDESMKINCDPDSLVRDQNLLLFIELHCSKGRHLSLLKTLSWLFQINFVTFASLIAVSAQQKHFTNKCSI